MIGVKVLWKMAKCYTNVSCHSLWKPQTWKRMSITVRWVARQSAGFCIKIWVLVRGYREQREFSLSVDSQPGWIPSVLDLPYSCSVSCESLTSCIWNCPCWGVVQKTLQPLDTQQCLMSDFRTATFIYQGIHVILFKCEKLEKLLNTSSNHVEKES